MSTPLPGLEPAHTYRMVPWARALVLAVGVAFVGGAAALALLIGRSAHPSAAAVVVPTLPLVLLGGYLLLGGLRSRVVLTAEAIESYGAFSVQRLARTAIKGRRLLRLQYGQTAVELVPREPAAKPLRHYSRGSKSTTYYLTLAPWGPRTRPEDVSVTRTLYGDTRPGAQVCVHQGPGALGIDWYVVKACG